MTDKEKKALALYGAGRSAEFTIPNFCILGDAFLEMRERHQAFKQEVSDAVEGAIKKCGPDRIRSAHIYASLHHLIISKPKPDSLVEVWGDLFVKSYNLDQFCAALEAQGLEIKEISK
jgi:hypothetical protein